MTDIRSTLERLIDRFPPNIAPGQRMQIERLTHDVSLVVEATPPGGRACDIGGGWGTIALGLAAAGLRSVLLDDFRDSGFFEEETMSAMRALYAEYGVEIVSRNVVTDGLDFPDRSLDAVTCFDSIEHWHGSPKKALHGAMRALRPGGLFVLATPNCVNLRKRITVPLGRGKWSAFHDWYEPELFRGHVREPDVDDLRLIAKDIGLQQVRIIGKNWNGHYSPNALTRRLTRLFDPLISLWPPFCADLYLIGHAASP